MNTTQRIAIESLIVTSLATGLFAYLMSFEGPWWLYAGFWFFGFFIYQGSRIKGAARENLANLYDQ